MLYHILKKGTKLYKGLNKDNKKYYDSLNDEPIWLMASLGEAKLYGDVIQEYELQTDIKLLNPLDPNFQNDYLGKLNLMYEGDNKDGLSFLKFSGCIPFGLPDYYVQQKYLKQVYGITPELNEWNETHDVASHFVGEKHRYSTFKGDQNMIKILKQVYGDEYNGYMTNIMWPSKFHDGLFHKEVCLFSSNLVKPNNIIRGGSEDNKQNIHLKMLRILDDKETIEYKKRFPNKPIFNDTWNRMDDELIRAYDGSKFEELMFKHMNKTAALNLGIKIPEKYL